VFLNFSDASATDDQDGLGRTALTYAVHFQQMQALQCLLENEANPNVTAHGKLIYNISNFVFNSIITIRNIFVLHPFDVTQS